MIDLEHETEALAIIEADTKTVVLKTFAQIVEAISTSCKDVNFAQRMLEVRADEIDPRRYNISIVGELVERRFSVTLARAASERDETGGGLPG